jgi:hypothetical protein
MTRESGCRLAGSRFRRSGATGGYSLLSLRCARPAEPMPVSPSDRRELAPSLDSLGQPPPPLGFAGGSGRHEGPTGQAD